MDSQPRPLNNLEAVLVDLRLTRYWPSFKTCGLTQVSQLQGLSSEDWKQLVPNPLDRNLLGIRCKAILLSFQPAQRNALLEEQGKSCFE